MARPFARSATTTAYFQPQLTAGPGGRLAFALPVRTGQASAMLGGDRTEVSGAQG
jgi:hypothetical protein